jgi:hypothetical protein
VNYFNAEREKERKREEKKKKLQHAVFPRLLLAM